MKRTFMNSHKRFFFTTHNHSWLSSLHCITTECQSNTKKFPLEILSISCFDTSTKCIDITSKSHFSLPQCTVDHVRGNYLLLTIAAHLSHHTNQVNTRHDLVTDSRTSSFKSASTLVSHGCCREVSCCQGTRRGHVLSQKLPDTLIQQVILHWSVT